MEILIEYLYLESRIFYSATIWSPCCSHNPRRSPVSLPQLVMMAKAPSPKTTWESAKTALAFGGSVVVVVSSGAGTELDEAGGGSVVVVGPAGACVVSGGAGGTVTVVSPSSPQDASISNAIRANRRIGAAYTAPAAVFVE